MGYILYIMIKFKKKKKCEWNYSIKFVKLMDSRCLIQKDYSLGFSCVFSSPAYYPHPPSVPASGTFGSSTVSWVDQWRSMHHLCSCTASFFTGYRTSTLPEVRLISFTTTHSCSSQWNASFCYHDSNKSIQTAPHHRHQQVGDLSDPLHLSLFSNARWDRYRLLHKQNM